MEEEGCETGILGGGGLWWIGHDFCGGVRVDGLVDVVGRTVGVLRRSGRRDRCFVDFKSEEVVSALDVDIPCFVQTAESRWSEVRRDDHVSTQEPNGDRERGKTPRKKSKGMHYVPDIVMGVLSFAPILCPRLRTGSPTQATKKRPDSK